MLVYLLLNKSNGKVYVGQTSHTLMSRWKWHKSSAKAVPARSIIAASIHKYGSHSFERFILADKLQTQKQTDNCEQLWIVLLRASNREFGYNIMPGGSHGAHTEETRNKISKTMRARSISPRQEIRLKGNAANRGLTRSAEAKAKMRAAKLGKVSAKKGKVYIHLHGRKDSEEVRKTKSLAAKRRGISPEVLQRMIAARWPK